MQITFGKNFIGKIGSILLIDCAVSVEVLKANNIRFGI